MSKMMTWTLSLLMSASFSLRAGEIEYGKNTQTFAKYSPLSSAEAIKDRYDEPDIDIDDYFDQERHYDITEESFVVYVPESYREDKHKTAI